MPRVYPDVQTRKYLLKQMQNFVAVLPTIFFNCITKSCEQIFRWTDKTLEKFATRGVHGLKHSCYIYIYFTLWSEQSVIGGITVNYCDQPFQNTQACRENLKESFRYDSCYEINQKKPQKRWNPLRFLHFWEWFFYESITLSGLITLSL